MKGSFFLALALPAGLSAVAQAAPPVPIEEDEAVLSQQAAPQQQPVAPPLAVPPPPPPAMPPPPPGVTGPVYFNGPVYIIPATPSGQPWPMAAPPQPPQQPEALPSPPQVQEAAPSQIAVAPHVVRRSVVPPVAQPRLGLALRMSGLWTDQRLYGVNLLMLGAGAQLRLRLIDRLVLEGAVDIVGAEHHGGVLKRTSYPVQLALLMYLRPYRPGVHFNVYALAGGGLVPSRIHVDDGLAPAREVSATEGAVQGGVGFELRLGRFALFSDARALGLWYLGKPEDVAGTPPGEGGGLAPRQQLVPASSYGWTFNAGVMLWL
jgi:hypothetical protein